MAAQILHDYREALLEDPNVLYLGNPTEDVLNRIQWTKSDNLDVVTEKDSSNAMIFSSIVKLSNQFFFLTSDTGWKGSAGSPPFEKIKPTAVGVKPDQGPDLNMDFENGLRTLKRLENMVEMKTPGHRSILEDDTGIRLRHVVFKKIDDVIDETRENIPEIDIHDWPVTTPQAGEAIKKIFDTHKAFRILAFDAEGNLIHPADYKRKLRGATVEVRFTISHFLIKGRGPTREGVQADIVRIDVIRPPTQTIKVNAAAASMDHHRPSTSTTAASQSPGASNVTQEGSNIQLPAKRVRAGEDEESNSPANLGNIETQAEHGINGEETTTSHASTAPTTKKARKA